MPTTTTCVDQPITDKTADVRFALLSTNDERDRPIIFVRDMTYESARSIAAARNTNPGIDSEFEVITSAALERLLDAGLVER